MPRGSLQSVLCIVALLNSSAKTKVGGADSSTVRIESSPPHELMCTVPPRSGQGALTSEDGTHQKWARHCFRSKACLCRRGISTSSHPAFMPGSNYLPSKRVGQVGFEACAHRARFGTSLQKRLRLVQAIGILTEFHKWLQGVISRALCSRLDSS